MKTPWIYLGLVVAVALLRLVELRLARRNLRWAMARGGVEVGVGHYPWMVLLHAMFLIACPLEVWWLQRPFHAPLAMAMLGVLVAAMALRYWAIATLGERWTTRIVVLPGLKPVTGGPYRYLRHPNYLAVICEIVAVPLIHGAWWTAIIFTILNAGILTVRIRAEERALSRYNDYSAAMGERGRFLP